MLEKLTLEAEYMFIRGAAVTEAIDDRLMMTPCFFFNIPGRTMEVIWKKEKVIIVALCTIFYHCYVPALQVDNLLVPLCTASATK